MTKYCGRVHVLSATSKTCLSNGLCEQKNKAAPHKLQKISLVAGKKSQEKCVGQLVVWVISEAACSTHMIDMVDKKKVIFVRTTTAGEKIGRRNLNLFFSSPQLLFDVNNSTIFGFYLVILGASSIVKDLADLRKLHNRHRKNQSTHHNDPRLENEQKPKKKTAAIVSPTQI